mmetsp:Transcript_258/g.342  ORF Transcript_258/g.342 Transcript_258/m.342 type:complete len:278 (+) Transcript_258:1123-1956(+)
MKHKIQKSHSRGALDCSIYHVLVDGNRRHICMSVSRHTPDSIAVDRKENRRHFLLGIGRIAKVQVILETRVIGALESRGQERSHFLVVLICLLKDLHIEVEGTEKEAYFRVPTSTFDCGLSIKDATPGHHWSSIANNDTKELRYWFVEALIIFVGSPFLHLSIAHPLHIVKDRKYCVFFPETHVADGTGNNVIKGEQCFPFLSKRCVIGLLNKSCLGKNLSFPSIKIDANVGLIRVAIEIWMSRASIVLTRTIHLETGVNCWEITSLHRLEGDCGVR